MTEFVITAEHRRLADILLRSGYRSCPQPCTVARIDRPDWMEQIAAYVTRHLHGAEEFLHDMGMTWAARPGAGEFYRLRLTRDRIKNLEPQVYFLIRQASPAVHHDRCDRYLVMAEV